MENQKKTGESFFQMPLHYPRYSRQDYEDMPEWKLDRLLAEYGITAGGDLPYKRQFAIGAFLWPDFNPNSLRRTFQDASSLVNKKVL